jgi:hypothetical protein
MVTTSADVVDTMLDDRPFVVPDQSQAMCQFIPQPQPPAPAPRPQTLERRPLPQTPESHLLSRLEHLGLVRPPKPSPVASTLPDAEAAGNTLDVDMNQHLLSESAAGDSLSDVPLGKVHLPDVPLPNVPLPEVLPDDSVGEE